MKLNLSFPALLLASAGLSAQPPEGTDWLREETALATNLSLWQQQDIHDYSFVMNAGCWICRQYFPARIVIENDVVVAVLNPETGEPLRRRADDGNGEVLVRIDETGLYSNIEGVFAYAAKAIENRWGTTHAGDKFDSLETVYDERYGYPRSISTIHDRGIGPNGEEYVFTDGGLSYELSELAPVE